MKKNICSHLLISLPKIILVFIKKNFKLLTQLTHEDINRAAINNNECVIASPPNFENVLVAVP